MGVSGLAATRYLVTQGIEVIAVDDDATRQQHAQSEMGVEVVVAPHGDQLGRLAASVDEIVVSPGVPASHPVFNLAGTVPLIGEVELAWRQAPMAMVAVTGTNGKTTVTTLVTEMLERSGLRAIAAGNIGVALIDAVQRDVDVVVAEVSSFQLALTDTFRPPVGVWLNFSEDHLDWHPNIEHYRQAKARLWANAGDGDVAVANKDDPVVVSAATEAGARGASVLTFGLGSADFTVADGALVDPAGDMVVAVEEMPRRHPHDIANALAALATARAAGGSLESGADVLRRFGGLPHRVQLVGEAGGVSYFDDSKSTTPGSTLAALEGFPSAVLIAGGRNKGLDLTVLRAAAPHLRGVVAIGEAAPEVTRVFTGTCPVLQAPSMAEAVGQARAMAVAGDAVVLSPACASFDWYSSYAERGDDFIRCVGALAGVVAPTDGPGATGGER